mgnify:CR=1 FL=1
MPAVIDKALDFIGAMDVSAPTPSSMNESTAKGIFKYLKELGVPASAADITAVSYTHLTLPTNSRV